MERPRVARRASGPDLTRRTVGGLELWVAESPPLPATVTDTVAHLLPPFDELLLGYRDRGASLRPEDAKRVNPGGGMPKPTVVIDGVVVGTWSRRVRAESWILTVDLFRVLKGHERRLLDEAAGRLADFASTRVTVTGRGGSD